MKDEKQNMTPLAQKVFERIEKENVVPTAKWRFVVKDGLFFGLWMTCVVLGAAAVAGMIFTLASSGWRYYSATHENFLTFLIDILPAVWILALLLIVALAYQNFKHTKNGYRYSPVHIFFLTIGGSVIVGCVFYFAGIGQSLDKIVAHSLKMQSVMAHQKVLWNQPHEGLISGEVQSVNMQNGSFTMMSFTGEQWEVRMDELSRADLETLSHYRRVRVVGMPAVESSSDMHACLVFPWDSRDASPGVEPIAINMDCGADCEIKIDDERISKCKDVRPYQALERLRHNY